MTYPVSTGGLIIKIDRVIQRLHDKRLGYYETVAEKYHNIKAKYYRSKGRTEDVPRLGFEAFISSDMRHELESEFDPSAVFMEFPGIGKHKIDIYVETDDAHAYVENKMYYSSLRNDYRHDFEKVLSLLDFESSLSPAVGFLVHFQLYENRNFPAHRLYEEFAKELDPAEWWSEIKCTGDKDKKHFVRLLFGRNE